MAASALDQSLHKGDKVVAAAHLRGVPEGTTGKVALVNGLSWIRYWVRFDNGVAIGSVNRSHLSTPKEWERKQSGVEDEAAGPAEAWTDGESAADGGGGDGVTTASGAVVPQKLIDRAKAARARLTA